VRVTLRGLSCDHGHLKGFLWEKISEVLKGHLYVDPQKIGFEFIPDGMPGGDKFRLDLLVTGIGTVPGGEQKLRTIKHDLCLALSRAASHKRVRHEISRCFVD